MAKLTDLQRSEIVKAAHSYLQEHELSQSKFSELAIVGKAHLNQILRGKTHIGETRINDKYYELIANAIGYKITVSYWRHFNTVNFKKIINTFDYARKNKERRGVDGDTGFGKTYACRKYKEKYPANTYLVTCAATDNAKELVQSIARTVGASEIGTKGKIVRGIWERLRLMDNDPILIIDEAENLGHAGVEIVKVLADMLEGLVGFAIVGIDISKILQKGSNRRKNGYVQTARRFSYGWTMLDELFTDDIESICIELGITSQPALKWIISRVSDYDSLRRICIEALEESDKSEKPVTAKMLETLYREMIYGKEVA